MQVKFIMQNNGENTLEDAIISNISKGPKKAYFIFGNLKESGFKIIEEELIDTKIKKFFIIGIDKKNTTRGMLDSMLHFTKDVYFYSNNNTVEFDSNICIFEYANEAYIYNCASSISESGIRDNISFYTQITYNLVDPKEKLDYKEYIKLLIKNIETFGFSKLDKEKIDELVESKEIFSTRQYTHTVKSISELFGKKNAENENNEMTKEEKDDIFVGNVEIPKVDISDIDIDISDIDLGEEIKVNDNANDLIEEDIKEDIELPKDYDTYSEEIEEEITTNNENKESNQIDVNNELYDENLKDMKFDKDSTLDIASMLFSKAKVKLDIDNDDKEEKSNTQDEMVEVKKVNLNNVSNFIFELPSKPTKGQDITKIKIPNYIQKIIPDFFELQDKGKSIEIDGDMYKKRNIKIEIVDVKENKKYTDREAKIMQKAGQSYLFFLSETLKKILYNENDIARIIKLSTDIYHIEIISSDMQEYKLWNKLCVQNFKSSTRKYGMM